MNNISQATQNDVLISTRCPGIAEKPQKHWKTIMVAKKSQPWQKSQKGEFRNVIKF